MMNPKPIYLATLSVLLMALFLPGKVYGIGFFNQAPQILELTVSQKQISPSEDIRLSCRAIDRDRDALGYEWSANGGSFDGDGPTVVWRAPQAPGPYTIIATVKDGKGGEATSQVIIDVLSSGNNPPIIDQLVIRPQVILKGKMAFLTCDATDPDGDTLAYNWDVKAGRISGSGPKVVWYAPLEEGNFEITCYVTDTNGNKSRLSSVTVKVICDCEGRSSTAE